MRCFGPVPSRRLGRSLGINNIPPKICTYACVYCQQGISSYMLAKRQKFYDPQELFREVKGRVEFAQSRGEHIDYLTIVPDGEPTLDINLGILIEKLHNLDFKTAVITNSSLLGRNDVIQELALADLVSVKVDALNEAVWRRINHPLKELVEEEIMEGLLAFSQFFKGKLITETMLIKNINDEPAELEATASFIARLNPCTAYLSIPTRPPALKWVEAPLEESINQAYQVFTHHLQQVECLIGFEGGNFAFGRDVESDILSTCSVHPMRQDALCELLGRAGRGWELVEKLISEEKMVEIEFKEKKFYMRKLYEGYHR